MTKIRDTFEIKPARLNWVEPHEHTRDWNNIVIDSVHDLDLADLWDYLQRITSKRWAGSPHREEMQGIASETFVHSVNTFDRWCAENSIRPSKKLFMHYAKKDAHFAILAHLKKFNDWDGDVHIDAYGIDDTPAETFLTQLRVRDHDRTMLHAIAPKISTLLNWNERFILALLTWEELSVTAAAELMGWHDGTLSRAASNAARKILTVSLNEVTTQVDFVAATRKSRTPMSIDLIRYIDDRYRTSPYLWLDRVEGDYMLDVSYLVEILDRAHGKTPWRGKTGASTNFKPTITDEQHQEIIARRAAGETQQHIADTMGITVAIIYSAQKREHKKRAQG